VSGVEDLVLEYLERRESEPDLAPEEFATRHAGEHPGLLPALRAALGAQAMLREAADPRPASIGPYRIVHEIGRGGMGVVYEAERDGEHVALKVLLHARMLGPRSLERFRRESAALRRVEHPGVVRVRDEGTVDGVPWIAMDLVPGRPLAELVGRTNPLAAAAIVRDLALAVDAVHEHGALHRDIKPSNVLVTARNRPVLCDFGLVHEDDAESLTSTGELVGTPRYMAPEQVQGAECDERTDVHALGLVLYELVSGRPAREGASRDAILRDVLRGTMPRPRQLAPDVPRDLERIVLQAAALDPSRRYASARGMAEDLDRFLAGTRVSARPPGVLSRAWSRARAAPLRTAAGVCGVLAVSTLVVLFARREPAREDGPGLELAIDRAAWAWVDGHERLARRHAALARALGPDDPEVVEFAALVETTSFTPAAATVAAEGPSARLRDLSAARTARVEGRLADARALLDAAISRHPGSAALAAESAWVEHEAGREDRARAALERAVELDPASLLAREALASWCFERGLTREGVEFAHAAARLASAEGEPPTRHPRLLERAPDAEELRAVLRERLVRDPKEVESAFALAMSLDGGHHLTEAVDAYEALLRIDPGHAFGQAYLGYLRLGALGERCERCVASYRAAPHVADRASGEAHLVRALAIDAGRDEDLLRTITSIALDKGLHETLASAIREQLQTRERSARTARLESALRRLE
jgi:tetratricopeptide (TPR) repeat protein